MMPELISSDGSIQAHDYRQIQERANPPPAYGVHNSDPIIVQYERADRTCACSEAMDRPDHPETVFNVDPPIYVS